MARQQGVELPPARLITILVLLATLVFGLGYLLHLPLLQVYWGIYARLRPMLSEQDLVQAGKPLPGTCGAVGRRNARRQRGGGVQWHATAAAAAAARGLIRSSPRCCCRRRGLHA